VARYYFDIHDARGVTEDNEGLGSGI